MKRIIGLGVVAVSIALVSQPAWAARTRMHDAAESDQYGEKAGGMIGRGLINVVTSPVDVLVNVVNETKAGPPFVGTLTGLGKGIGCGALRLGSGAVDIVTFWVPGFNGFPVSDSYENCLAGGGRSARAVSRPVLAVPQSTAVSEAAPVEAAAETEPSKKWYKK